MNFPSSRQHVERKTKIFIIHASKSVHAHTLRPTHTHLSDIRSLYCPLKFSGSQISIDERISIKHVWDAARNRELWTSYLHRSLCPSNPSFFPSPSPPLSLRLPLSEQEPPVVLSITPLLSSLSVSFSPSCLSCLWQIGKLCFTNVGTCVKWGSIVCLTGCLY